MNYGQRTIKRGKRIKIRGKIINFVFLVSFVILLLGASVSAAENEFGAAKAWIKLQDGEWQNASVYDVTLKVHEPFNVKLTVTTKVECNVYILIDGAGSTVTYELIEGPSEYDDYLDNYNCPIGWNQTFEWVARPTGNWTEGTAPLNAHIFFFTMEEDKKVGIGLINAYISPEEWEGSTTGNTNGESSNDDNNQGQSTPGFELILVVYSIALALFWKRRLK